MNTPKTEPHKKLWALDWKKTLHRKQSNHNMKNRKEGILYTIHKKEKFDSYS